MSAVLSSSRLMAFVATSDTARAKTFYGETLGLKFVSEDPFAVVFDSNGTMVRVTPAKEVAVGGYTVLGWQVADIDAAVSELSGKGIVFERFPGLPQEENGVWCTPGGTKVAWFKDPDGHILSFSQHS